VSTSSPTPTPTSSPSPRPSPTAGASLPASLRGTEWVRIPTSQKVVALTFDAGANADAVDAILRTLADTDTPATFFLTGGFVDRFPDAAARIARAHPVGNHSQTHPAFTELADAEVREEVAAAERRIRQVTGTTPAPLFRFPFGDRDARTIRLVNELGYGSIRWTVDTLGWQGTSGGRSASSVTDRVLASATPGQIVLLHVGSHPTDRSTLDADALSTIVRELRARGYRFVTLREAIAIAG
jgi:peptidoglycan/xylan/chitin deacetylase (PgdA/CDA1 family)